ncbi:MAG: DUF3365 domain-containing protein [Pyrinomonadaceae bacterium]|nr:DUF3365 domain-containing protein [Pyrinomonadaceae bacterium]
MNKDLAAKVGVFGAMLFGSIVIAAGLIDSRSSAQKIENTPPIEIVDKFDAAIQNRFLTEPNFGIRRIQPTYPTNPHLSEYFEPKEGAETESVKSFQESNFRAGLYLFGRRITEIEDPKGKKRRFNINYRLHNPLGVTRNFPQEKLKSPQKLLDEIKTAFMEFRTKDSYEFESGKWSYIARPVRALESCLKCHNDYVITEVVGKNDYKFRKRQAGDVNGILVYAFRKTSD